MGARFLIARAEMRRSALALVLLGLLAGLVGATVTGVATVARRSATAYERLERATAVDDARGAIIGVGEEETQQLVEAINAFDGVAAARVAPFFISRFREGPITFPSFALLDDDPALPFQPVVVAGRALDPRAPDEVVLIDSVAAELGIEVGAVLPVRLLRQQEVFDFGADIDPPIGTGPEADLTVVGLVRISGTNDSIPPMFASPAFRDAHPGAESSGVFNFVDLHDRSDWPAFERAAQEAGAGVDTPEIVSPVAMAAPSVSPERLAQDLGDRYEFSGPSAPPSVDNLAQIRGLPLALGVGLSLLALISMAYAVNGVARHRRRDLAVLTALGFTRRNRLAVLITFATVLALLLATVGGFAGLIAGSSVWRVLARDAALASTIERPVALLLTVPVTAVVALALGAAAAARTWRMRPGPHLRAE